MQMKDITTINWEEHNATLNAKGYALIGNVLSHEECQSVRDWYGQRDLFRSTIDMQRYRFGYGEYKYFSYPLPDIIRTLRAGFYGALTPLANEWMSQLGAEKSYPETHEKLIRQCRAAGQHRPTPLLLRYEEGGYNTLHQDLYGDIYFPFQVVLPLTEPRRDHEGGELVFVEQLPRAQSRVEVLSPAEGDAVVFTTNFRPVKGKNGFYRARMKHGISRVRSGVRYSMGVIFHDAA